MLAITPLFLLLIHLVTLTEGARIPGSAPIPPRRSRFSRKSVEVPSNTTEEIVKRATDPWASQTNFNWNTWIGWGFYDHTLDYTKQWYYANYGTGLPYYLNSWQDLSSYVSYFGTPPASLSIVPCRTTYTLLAEAATVYPYPRCSVATTAPGAAFSASSLAAYSASTASVTSSSLAAYSASAAAATASASAYSKSSLAAYSASASAANSAAAAQASASWTAAAQGQNIRTGWTAMGCFRDSPTRVLASTYIATTNMTNGYCVDYCSSKGYTFAGTQFGGECWCGNVFNGPGIWTGTNSDTYIKSGDPYGVQVDFSQCQLQSCSGDASQPCGGHWRMNTFQLTDPAAYSAYQYSTSAAPSLSAYSSRAAATFSASASAYSVSAAAFSVSSAAASASAYSTSVAAYSTSSLAAYSAAVTASASMASASSRAAWSQASANAYSSSSANVYSQASIASAASAFSQQSLAAYSQASAAAYSQATSLAGYSASAAAAFSQSSSIAAAASQYSQAAAQFSQASLAAYSQSSAAAYSQATSLAGYSASSQAAAFSQSSAAAFSQQSLAAYSKAASAYSSAATAYSQAASAFSQSSLVASASQFSQASAAAYSQSAAAYSQASAAAYSQASAAAYSQASAAAYSQASAAAYSQAAAAYSQASVAAYSQASAAAYSQSAAAAYSQASQAAAQQSLAAYSQASAAAYSQAAAAYSQATSIAGYSSVSAASASSRAQWSSQSALQASQSALAASLQGYSASVQQYSQSVSVQQASATAYSQSVSAQQALQSAQAYSQAAAQYSQSVVALQASQSAQAYSQSAAQLSQSIAGYSASLAGYSQSVSAAQASQSAALFSQAAAAFSQSASAVAAQNSAAAYSAAASFSAAAASASAAAYSATSAAAYQAQQSLAAYSAAAQSLSAYSANLNNQIASSSLNAYSAAQSLAAYSQNLNDQAASASQSAAAYSSSVSAALAQATPALVLPSGWSSVSAIGIAEGTSGRALQGPSISASNMTIPMCLNYCQSQNFKYAGLEYTEQCFCGNSLQGGASLSLTSPNCNMKCGGDNQICGGPDCLTMFVNPTLGTTVPSVSPVSSAAAAVQTVALPSGWSVASPGVAEGTSGRALQGASTSSSTMNVPQCLNFCQSKGFQYAGLEYSEQCFCGNALVAGASLSLTSNNCNMPCGGDKSTICGGGDCLSLYVNPSLAVAATSSAPVAAPTAILPSGWTVASPGIAEGQTGRALQGASTSSDKMTPTLCANFCASKGFPYAGMEYASECFCGAELAGGASLSLTSPNANMPCSGDSTQMCGGPSCLTLLYNPSIVSSVTSVASSAVSSAAAAATSAAAPVSLPSGWSVASSACIQEVNGRALTGASTSGSSMTLETCLNFCASKGFGLAGIEFGQECFCGGSLVNGASLSLISNQCTMPCAGNAAEMCGGPNAIQLFSNPNMVQSVTSSVASATSSAKAAATSAITINGFTSTGCLQEVNGRALTGSRKDDPNMTLDMCIGYCSGLGFKMMAIEYGQECYCGNELSNGASLSLVSGQCNMPCPGNSAQTCGGPNALQYYVNPNGVAAPSSAAATSTSSKAPAATVALPSGWSVASTPCLLEGTTGGRALAATSTSSPQMTISMCLNFCQDKGYQYAGIEYSSECFCANSFSNGASLSIPATQCNMKCSGDASSICGGPDSLSLFNNPSLAQAASASPSPAASSATPSPVVASASASSSTSAAAASSSASVPDVNGFASRGCIQEVAGRALNSDRYDDPAMTIDKCTSYCTSKGYSMAGVEYGAECYCSNTLSGGASTSLVSGQCYMPCPGNASQLCGGPNAIQLYQLRN